MKKFFILFVVLVISASFVVAQVSVGADFGIDDINEPDGAEKALWADAWVGYDTSFGDLDFHTDLTYNFGFTKEPNDDGKEVYPQSLDFDLDLTYNLSLGSASTLMLDLDHLASFTITPRPKEANIFTGTLTPLVRFTQRFDFGSIYIRVAAPIDYIDEDKDAELAINPNYRLGWNSTFGLSLWVGAYTSLIPDSEYLHARVNVSYATGPVVIGVLTRIPKDLNAGIRITPRLDFNLGAFDFYADCLFIGIAAKEGSVSINPSVGVAFGF
jgi:hypothetical protein